MSKILEFKAVSKTYTSSDLPAVSDISFHLNRAESLSLVGHSGCGKTSILRLAAGLEIPNTGSITVNGNVVAGEDSWVQPEKREIGMVFQGGALFPHLNAMDNIAFGLHKVKPKDRKPRIMDMLELVGLPDYAKRFPHELSGGERQRLALARALAPQPKIVLLDEPFSNLYRTLRYSLRDEVHKILKKVEASSIFVTHDIEDAVSISDYLVILNKGKIIQSGSTNEVHSNPNCDYCSEIVAGIHKR